jgi:CPA2 family monovalent cation:H+ antiporter-2
VETTPHAFPLTEVATVIGIAVLLGLGLMRLRQPPLVGFILAGVLLGPTGFGLIRTNDNVSALAEMGVLVLLFVIGTELSLKAFVYSLKDALTVAAGQIAASLAIALGLAALLGATAAEAIILGFIIALSSTVVAMKMLDDMGVLRKQAGRIAVGVLIAQDIAIVPMLILISSLGRGEPDYVTIAIRVTVAVALLAGLLWWLGRSGKLKLPFAANVQDRTEMLALGALAACFGGAAVSGYLGLSPVYGSFVAGLVIGNSNLRTAVIPVVEPIQSVLLVVFFLSIGLLIDLNFIWDNLGTVIAATLFVVAAKSALNVLLLRATGYDRDTALIGGLSMAQIGEFSFVLAAAGFSAGALGFDSYRLAIAVTAITLLISPAWMSVMHRIHELANQNYTSYRAALSDAYADEIGNVEEGLWWLRVRYRAGRIAWRRRQVAARRETAGTVPDAPEETMAPALGERVNGAHVSKANGAGETGAGERPSP